MHPAKRIAFNASSLVAGSVNTTLALSFVMRSAIDPCVMRDVQKYWTAFIGAQASAGSRVRRARIASLTEVWRLSLWSRFR